MKFIRNNVKCAKFEVRRISGCWDGTHRLPTTHAACSMAACCAVVGPVGMPVRQPGQHEFSACRRRLICVENNNNLDKFLENFVFVEFQKYVVTKGSFGDFTCGSLINKTMKLKFKISGRRIIHLSDLFLMLLVNLFGHLFLCTITESN